MADVAPLDRGRFDRAGLVDDPFALRRAPAGSVVALRTDVAAVVAGALTVLEGHAAEVHLLPAGVDAPPGVGAPDLQLSADGTELGAIGWSATAAATDVETRWVLSTSGTTGLPKSIGHTRASLTRTIRPTPRAAGLVWGLLYDPNRMAGLQVLLQSLCTDAPLVAPALHDPLPQRIRDLVLGGTTALSATPTMWRRILQVPGIDDWAPEQLTLGGEIADQLVLDGLRHRFPKARITHVFASTETGAAFSVHDGRAGFPASYLDEAPGGVRLDVRDGILWVHSPGSSTAEADGFASTGDVVERVDDRVLFRGRASGVVNVGGTNVWPEEVEALVRSHPDVLDAVVSATPNPLAGNLLVASVVVAAGADPDAVRKGLRRWVRDRAPTSHVPAQVTVVDDLTHATTGKASR